MFERLKAMVKSVPPSTYRARNRVLLLLEGVLGLPATSLTELNLGAAKALLVSKGTPEALWTLKVVKRYQEVHELGDGEYVVRSRKGQGSRPVNRVTLWRIFSTIPGGSLRYFQRIAKRLSSSPYPSRVGGVAPVPSYPGGEAGTRPSLSAYWAARTGREPPSG